MNKQPQLRLRNILNIYNNIKKHGWKKTKEQWYHNYLMLETPEASVKKEIVGYIGSFVGLLFAIIVFWIRDSKVLIPVMAFGLLIVYTNLKMKLKVYHILKKPELFMETINE